VEPTPAESQTSRHPEACTTVTRFSEYEQGNNAGEIQQFDPLVEEGAARIREAKLRRPKGGIHPPVRREIPRP